MATRKVKTPRPRKSKAPSTDESLKTQGTSADRAEIATVNHAPSTDESLKTQGTSSDRAEIATVNHVPTMEEIRRRAYQLYLDRGGTHGSDWDDWFVAEKQLMETHATSA